MENHGVIRLLPTEPNPAKPTAIRGNPALRQTGLVFRKLFKTFKPSSKFSRIRTGFGGNRTDFEKKKSFSAKPDQIQEIKPNFLRNRT